MTLWRAKQEFSRLVCAVMEATFVKWLTIVVEGPFQCLRTILPGIKGQSWGTLSGIIERGPLNKLFAVERSTWEM